MAENHLDKAAFLLRKSRHAVAFTGAGASTESGIPDFRGKNGLWSRYDPLEYGTLGAFTADPEKVWHMLGGLLEIVEAEPNRGHRALAALEHQGLLAGIITQNIDGLHQKAGSRNVLEYHGGLETFSCLSCGADFSADHVRKVTLPPHCTACNAILKPDIIFFDELIPATVLRLAERMLNSTDLLLVAGTSCQVPPAARLPFTVYNRGGSIIEINREPVLGHIAAVTLQGNFATLMEELLEHVAQRD